MQVWNVRYAACSKYRMQKIAKNSPSGHHRTTLSSCIFATKTCNDNRKKNPVKQQYVLHVFSQYGELRPTNGWGRLGSLWHPSKFQRVSRLAFLTAATSLNGPQPNYARCLATSCAGTRYIHFRGLLLPKGILPGAKFTSPTSLAFTYIGSVSAWHLSIVDVSQTLRHRTRNGITEVSPRATPIFGRAAIMLGIGPHSSL